MRTPPYHLRLNKTADRLAFIEVIGRLDRLGGNSLSEYAYHGLGGPYLEEYRLMYEAFPEMEMVSIERHGETIKRQRFHRPSTRIRLENSELSSYIAAFDPGASKTVFWLDFNDLTYSNFEQFMALLPVVNRFSVLKMTLKCDPKRWKSTDSSGRNGKGEVFRSMFSALMPNPDAQIPGTLAAFAALLQSMLRVAVEQSLPPSASDSTFVPVSSFYYADGIGMFTLTGLVCEEGDRASVIRAYRDWSLVNFDWNPPKRIDLPFLSTKERLALQDLLPAEDDPGDLLNTRLGYLIDDDMEKSVGALEQYAIFHRHAPYIMKAIP